MIEELLALRRRVDELERRDVPIVGIGARVYNSGAISCASGALTLLTFDSERYDTDQLHSTSSNTGRLTAQRPGVYLVTGNVEFAASATGYRQLVIRLNGATQIGNVLVGAAAGGIVTQLQVVTLYQLAAGDYVELGASQNSGGALNAQATGNASPEFAIHRLT